MLVYWRFKFKNNSSVNKSDSNSFLLLKKNRNMKNTLTLLLLVGAFALSSCGSTATTEKADLVLTIEEEMKIEDLYVLAHKVTDRPEKGLTSNVDVADEEVVFGGGLVFKGAELEIKEKIYVCTSINEKEISFKLK
jgi:hypothetical protein